MRAAEARPPQGRGFHRAPNSCGLTQSPVVNPPNRGGLRSRPESQLQRSEGVLAGDGTPNRPALAMSLAALAAGVSSGAS